MVLAWTFSKYLSGLAFQTWSDKASQGRGGLNLTLKDDFSHWVSRPLASPLHLSLLAKALLSTPTPARGPLKATGSVGKGLSCHSVGHVPLRLQISKRGTGKSLIPASGKGTPLVLQGSLSILRAPRNLVILIEWRGLTWSHHLRCLPGALEEW